jgi:hypothetical protein
MFNIFSQDLSIGALSNLRQTSKNFRLIVNEFVRRELKKLLTQGPSFARAFLATEEPLTKDNADKAWRILGLFKKAYPSLSKDMSIEKACKQLNDQLDQATIALKDALVESSPQVFADLRSKQTPEQIREWFANPINLPLLQGVQELNLEGRGLSLVPSELRFLSNLQWLNLGNNQLTSIDPQTFANLPNLEYLYLDHNQLTAIDPQTFTNLPNLQQLYLHQNQLKAIAPQTFANLQNLQVLDLNGNQLTSIAPQTFANLANLRWLFLGQNQLTSVAPQTFANLL